jgi:hypothetical protein
MLLPRAFLCLAFARNNVATTCSDSADRGQPREVDVRTLQFNWFRKSRGSGFA